MARKKVELTPHLAGSCWKKFRNGIFYYLGKGLKQFTHGYRGIDPACPHYKAALAEWQELLAKLESDEALGIDTTTPDYQRALKAWRKLPADSRPPTLPTYLAAASSLPPVPPSQIVNAYAVALNVQKAMATVADKGLSATAGTAHPAGSIAELVEHFMGALKTKVLTKQLGPQSFIEYQRNLQFFIKWCGQVSPPYTRVEQIDHKLLTDYKSFILGLTSAEFAASAETPQIAYVTVGKRLGRLKTLVKWAYDEGHIPALPRKFDGFTNIIDPEGAEASYDPGNKRFWTVAELRELYSLATDRTKLYLLLGANCGFTQADVSSLRWSHVDWDAGEIRRPRNKTKKAGKGKGCLQVSKLWPETLRLLVQERADPQPNLPGKGHVLLGDGGLPLLTQSIETMSKIDVVKLSWNRLIDKWVKRKLRAERPEVFQLATRKSSSMSAGKLLKLEDEKLERKERIRAAMAEARVTILNGRSFMHLRKTSANMIAEKYGNGNGTIYNQFLGHAPRSIADKFYVEAHYKQLFEAIEYLRQTYDFQSVVDSVGTDE